MKKIGIYTLNGNHNYGNRLQNYALHFFTQEITNQEVITIWFPSRKQLIKDFLKAVIFEKRLLNFMVFSKKHLNIKYYNPKNINLDYYIVGSDQVWNYNSGLYDRNAFLFFSNNYNKNIAYAASFGRNEISKEREEEYKNGLNNIKYISIREDRGKEIIEELTGRKDVEVLIDPTMLLTNEQWDKVSKKPKMLKTDKYILNYFLGELSEARKKEIQRIAKENDCEIINLLDKKSPFYVCGPSEFLYLEKHAFLICTDSFHSSVFAILYNRPFIVFDREQEGLEDMSSRLDTLINKFKLKNRKYNGKNITKENLEHDYAEAYKILEQERKKSDAFLKEALEIKDSDSSYE